MRTLLLLLAASGILLLIFLRPAATAPEVEAAGAGTMLAPEEPPASTESPAVEDGVGAAVAGAVPSPAGGVDPAPAAAETSHAAPAPVSAPSDANPVATVDQDRVANLDPALELSIAARLVHAPQEAEALIDAANGLSEDRRTLARAFAALVLDRRERAAQLLQAVEGKPGIRSEELEFLTAAARGGDVHATAASTKRGSPLLLAAQMGSLVSEGEQRLKRGDSPAAALCFSRVLLEELGAPWPVDPVAMRGWSDALHRAQRGHRWKRDGDWPALEARVEEGDSLIGVRKRVVEQHPQLLVCTGLIAHANGLSGEVIHPREVLRIPTERVRMLVSLRAHWALYLMGDEVVASFEVGVGQPGSQTKPGEYLVGDKRRDPMWFPPGKEPVPYGDPRNPLGSRWVELELPDGQPSHLGFHGTNEPDSVGKDASQGCLRMRKQDIELLYEILPKGAAVSIQA